MNANFHINDIIIDGLNTIENKKRRVFLLLILPFFLGFFFTILANLIINESYVNIIISSLSIFTGFFFTLIVYVADKAASKKNEYKIKINEEDKRFINTYLNFTENLISQISYSILLSIIIIVLSLLSQLNLPCVYNKPLCSGINIVLSAVIISIIFHFIIYLLLIVSNMYALFLQEIKR